MKLMMNKKTYYAWSHGKPSNFKFPLWKRKPVTFTKHKIPVRIARPNSQDQNGKTLP